MSTRLHGLLALLMALTACSATSRIWGSEPERSDEE